MANVVPFRGVAIVDSDDLVCVPAGVYDLNFLDWEARVLHGAPKVILNFSIVTMGDFFNARVARYYHVRWIRKRAFKAGWHSDLVREYARLFNQKPDRIDRIPMNRYRGSYIEGKVRTVKTDRRQREIPAPLHYSVVAELLRVKEGQ